MTNERDRDARDLEAQMSETEEMGPCFRCGAQGPIGAQCESCLIRRGGVMVDIGFADWEKRAEEAREESRKEMIEAIRDRFAGKALTGFIQTLGNITEPWSNVLESVAADCYKIADAMMEARKR